MSIPTFLKLLVAIDKPSKFHISTQLESTARDILAARAEDRIQAGHFMRTQEMPVNSKLQGCVNIYFYVCDMYVRALIFMDWSFCFIHLSSIFVGMSDVSMCVSYTFVCTNYFSMLTHIHTYTHISTA